MKKIRFLNPSDPVITSIADMFNTEHRHINLLNKLKLAEKGDYNANNFLRNEPLLSYGMKNKLPRKHFQNNLNAASEYFYAVAYAQRRLKWEGNELLQLKHLIKENYQKSKWLDVQKIITDIAYELGETSLDYEKHFFNYMIDSLIYLSAEKKIAFKNAIENEVSFIDKERIDSEVTSSENGFILRMEQPEKIYDLLLEAASTPWHVNEGR